MGSGRANTELTYAGKKPREKRRRMKIHRKRLAALGVPEAVVRKANAKELRQLLARPAKTKAKYAKQG